MRPSTSLKGNPQAAKAATKADFMVLLVVSVL